MSGHKQWQSSLDTVREEHSFGASSSSTTSIGKTLKASTTTTASEWLDKGLTEKPKEDYFKTIVFSYPATGVKIRLVSLPSAVSSSQNQQPVPR